MFQKSVSRSNYLYLLGGAAPQLMCSWEIGSCEIGVWEIGSWEIGSGEIGS